VERSNSTAENFPRFIAIARSPALRFTLSGMACNAMQRKSRKRRRFTLSRKQPLMGESVTRRYFESENKALKEMEIQFAVVPTYIYKHRFSATVKTTPLG